MDDLDNLFDGGSSTTNNTQNQNDIFGGTTDFTGGSNSNQSGNEIDRIPSFLSESEMNEKVDDILQKWKKGVSEPKNLLLLLSTLHEVWSKDEKLRDISVKDMVDNPNKATKEYRKAMLLFHDDKIKNYSKKEQYVAKSLYYILNEANVDHNNNNSNFK